MILSVRPRNGYYPSLIFIISPNRALLRKHARSANLHCTNTTLIKIYGVHNNHRGGGRKLWSNFPTRYWLRCANLRHLLSSGLVIVFLNLLLVSRQILALQDRRSVWPPSESASMSWEWYSNIYYLTNRSFKCLELIYVGRLWGWI